MEYGVFGAIAAWSHGELPEETVLAVLQKARQDVAGHRTGFGQVAGELSARQRERCQPLIDFAGSLLDQLDHQLAAAVAGLSSGDRAAVIRSGDQMTRASFQLNQTFVEFSQQAMRAMGPTHIPNLNHLLRRREEYQASPGPRTARPLWEALDGERMLASQTLHALRGEPDLGEVKALRSALTQHLDLASKLAARLRSVPPAGGHDLSAFSELEATFQEISTLYPLVARKLRGQGAPRYRDLDLLLGLLDDLQEGTLTDASVEELERTFAATAEQNEAALRTESSALIAGEIRGILEAYQVFPPGLQAVRKFLQGGNPESSAQGRSLLREFAARYLVHLERLDMLRDQQGKPLCPYCSHFSEPGARHCERCAQALP